MVFQCSNICQVPCEVLKTATFGLGFQQLPQDLANVNAWKTMFDPYIDPSNTKQIYSRWQSDYFLFFRENKTWRLYESPAKQMINIKCQALSLKKAKIIKLLSDSVVTIMLTVKELENNFTW